MQHIEIPARVVALSAAANHFDMLTRRQVPLLSREAAA
jgi:hypothetical protein